MQLSRMKTAKLAFAAMSGLILLTAAESRAESAYVAQIPASAVTNMAATALPHEAQSFGQLPSPTTVSLPEGNAAPGRGGNYASTLEIGARNTVFTLQGGANSISTTGVIGNDNNVAVLQGGNNLKSNVVLLNASHMNVGVIQPRGSAPVNVLIARLPGGGLLIKR